MVAEEGGAEWLTLPEVLDRIKIGRSKLYALMNERHRDYDPTFPKATKIHSKNIWRADEINHWRVTIENRARSKQGDVPLAAILQKNSATTEQAKRNLALEPSMQGVSADESLEMVVRSQSGPQRIDESDQKSTPVSVSPLPAFPAEVRRLDSVETRYDLTERPLNAISSAVIQEVSPTSRQSPATASRVPKHRTIVVEVRKKPAASSSKTGYGQTVMAMNRNRDLEASLTVKLFRELKARLEAGYFISLPQVFDLLEASLERTDDIAMVNRVIKAVNDIYYSQQGVVLGLLIKEEMLIGFEPLPVVKEWGRGKGIDFDKAGEISKQAFALAELLPRRPGADHLAVVGDCFRWSDSNETHLMGGIRCLMPRSTIPSQADALPGSLTGHQSGVINGFARATSFSSNSESSQESDKPRFVRTSDSKGQ